MPNKIMIFGIKPFLTLKVVLDEKKKIPTSYKGVE